MEEYGPHRDMKKDALETNHEDSSILKHVKAFFDQKVGQIPRKSALL
jgi:hypothetical protein